MISRASTAVWGVLLVLLCFSGAVSAKPNPVTWTGQVAPSPARAGETVTLTLTATIPAPYHIYSSVRPKAPEGAITPQTTEATVTAPGLTPVGTLQESAPRVIDDPNFDLKLGLHEKQATFTQAFKVGTGATGNLPFDVSVNFQACNEKVCLPAIPVKVTVAPLAVEAGAARAEYSGVPATPAPTATAGAAGGVLDVTRKDTGDLWGFLVTAFGAGLVALVTPCVFPLIPATFGYFTKQVGANGGSVLKLAATYCIAIVVSFTGIGAVMAATLGAAGANQIASNPYVNLVFAGLFVLFGIALLEIVELRLPSGLQNLSGKGRQVGGTLGVFFMGLTFVIAAFTCTAPFIGTVLVAASQASSGVQWVRPLLGMTAFSTALALPFFVLALFPSLLAKLPRSGAWLSTVKGAMGFLELAAALKFLSNVDLVWQWKILTQPVMLALWALIAVLGGLWLWGLLRIGLFAPDAPPPPARKAWATVFFLAGLYFVYGLTGRPLQDDLVAFLPPAEYGYGSGSEQAGQLQAKKDALPFLPTLEVGLAQAKAENKPIFIDFTGYACVNCRKMERIVFPVPEVHDELQKFVRVRLYVDGGADKVKNSTYQEKTFGDVAMPLYAILTPEGKPVAKTAGMQASADFVSFLRAGQERQGAKVAQASP